MYIQSKFNWIYRLGSVLFHKGSFYTCCALPEELSLRQNVPCCVLAVKYERLFSYVTDRQTGRVRNRRRKMRAKKNRSTSSLSWKSSNNTLLNTAQCFFYRSLEGGFKTINRDMIFFFNCNSIHRYHHDRMCGTTHLSFHPCYQAKPSQMGV